MQGGGLAAVSRAESAVHHMDSTAWPAAAGIACALAVGATVVAVTTVATGGLLTILPYDFAVNGLIRR